MPDRRTNEKIFTPEQMQKLLDINDGTTMPVREWKPFVKDYIKLYNNYVDLLENEIDKHKARKIL